MRNFWLKAFWLVLLLQASAIGLAQVSCVNYPRDNYIEVNFHLPDYRIIDSLPDSIYEHPYIYNYILVDNPEFGIIDSVGCPELPQLTINLNIPWNAHDVSFKILDIGSTVVELDYPYYPHQPDISLDDSVNIHKFFINGDLYDTIGAFPVNAADTGELFILRDRKGITLCIMPFIYNGRYNTIRVIRSMQLRVDYLTDSIVEERVDSNGLWEDYYKGIFENYTAQNTGGAGTSGRYLMVVHENLSQAIGSFMAYKRNIGYAVDTITIRSADATPSLIKAKIQQRYDNPATRPDFVLLVGDNELLPAYSGNSSGLDEDNPLTDLFYACVKGNDLKEDMFIGRWPASYCGEVSVMTNKTIFMEANMHLFDKKALFVAGDQKNSLVRWWWLEQFRAANDEVSENSFAPAGYDIMTRHQPTEAQLRSSLSSNPLIFVYSGHGNFSQIGPLKYGDSDFKINSDFVSTCQKDIFPIMFVFACKTGNFGCNDAIGEHWIASSKGAVSYFGSSVISITKSDNMMERRMLGESFFELDHLGAIIASGKQKYRRAFWKFLTFYERYSKAYNLLGDPSFCVRGWGCGHDYWLENTTLNYGDTHVYHAADYANVTSCTVGTGARLAVTSGGEIVIGDGFEASYGSNVVFSIEPCVSSVTTKSSLVSSSGSMNTEIDSSPEIQIEGTKVTIYPSPAQDMLYVKFHSVERGVSFRIIDVYGRTVINKTVNVSSVDEIVENIDVSNLTQGCYFVVAKIDGITNKPICIIKQ